MFIIFKNNARAYSPCFLDVKTQPLAAFSGAICIALRAAALQAAPCQQLAATGGIHASARLLLNQS